MIDTSTGEQTRRRSGERTNGREERAMRPA
jgi:hypothetical protein